MVYRRWQEEWALEVGAGTGVKSVLSRGTLHTEGKVITLQLTPEQHSLELRGSTYLQIFFLYKYSPGLYAFLLPHDFTNIFSHLL